MNIFINLTKFTVILMDH